MVGPFDEAAEAVTEAGLELMNEVNTLNGARLIIPFIANPPSVHGAREGHAADTRRALDHVELSATATALAELYEDSSMRIDKVARIRSEIQNGLYDMNGKLEAVIDRLLEDILA